MKKLFTLISVLLTMSIPLFAQQADPVDLYPAGVPNSKPTPANYKETLDANGFVVHVSTPQLLCFFAPKDKANGTAVIICPGGGYAGLSLTHEGIDVAHKFNEIGITAFVLKYRLPSDEIMIDRTIGPLQDAQRAVQMVRQNAAKWNIDVSKVGIIGFSAGGHLASTAGTHFSKAVIPNSDNTNLRPDFMMLIYPVIDLGQYAHPGSRENLIGKDATKQLTELYSNEKQVTASTPPTFIIHAQDDNVVPVQNTLQFYDALQKNGIKAEMHVYEHGGHGFGLNNAAEKTDWFVDLTNWLKVNGWVK